MDNYGHPATGDEGTVTFFTSDKDPGVLLPADYTFTADDQGIHTFAGESVLVTPGEQSLWALDTDGQALGRRSSRSCRVARREGKAGSGGPYPTGRSPRTWCAS